eukprot:g30240.t1
MFVKDKMKSVKLLIIKIYNLKQCFFIFCVINFLPRTFCKPLQNVLSKICLAPFSARPQQEQAKQPKHEKLFLSFSADFDAQEQD